MLFESRQPHVLKCVNFAPALTLAFSPHHGISHSVVSIFLSNPRKVK